MIFKLVILVLVLFLAGCTMPEVRSIREKDLIAESPVTSSSVTLENGRFKPSSVILNKNSLLSITNSDKKVWTLASDPHPAHDQPRDIYKILRSREIYELEYTQTGSWGLHLEENPSIRLKIVIE